jgi:hypothetical protein
LTPQDAKTVLSHQEKRPGRAELTLIETADPRNEGFVRFCDDLAALAPQIAIFRKKDHEKAFPELLTGSGVRYRGIPTGLELAPFLEILFMSGEAVRALPEPVDRKIRHADLPAFLSLFISIHCPFCPEAVRQVVRIAAANRMVRLLIIDAELFPENTRTEGVRSVPALLLDDAFRWTGRLPLEEIADAIANRDPARVSAASLENIIGEGDAGRISEMMLSRNLIFPAWVELLLHPKWPVRLGAMVAFEEIAEKRPELAAQALDSLWERFPDADDPVKGDILYLTGISEIPGFLPRVEAALEVCSASELREAAEEARARLKA